MSPEVLLTLCRVRPSLILANAGLLCPYFLAY